MADTHTAILVVDDVAENRDLLSRRLKRMGFTQIEEAENGVEALAAIDRRAFDLVLLDIMMPVLDGFGVLEQLKADGRINDLPVVVVSALNDIEPLVRCVELGADDFLFKPFNPTLLRARVLATLEKKALRDRTRDELKRKQVELAEARTLQLALAPPRFGAPLGGSHLRVSAMLEPAKEVGGDLVDYFAVDGDKLAMLVGDVSDKGAGAALVMARTHAMFRALAARPDAGELFARPERAVALVNDALAVGNANCMFVTLFLATLDLDTRRLAYVRAGHVPPFLRRADGEVVRLEVLSGPPLGVADGIAYRAGSIELQPGDSLLAVTDGFTEAQDPAGELYGEEPIARFLAATPGLSAETLPRLAGEVRTFEAGLPAFDDMAALMLALDGPA
ncbi:fused response regulator/phosphatase [Ancylobacter sp. A5.8]|uniref:PP2C family protein-serine/threonine phosphatase n=1 Tax=Ancylobacter gelatini TaxID=2919920 RepID=UPI001F4E451F|nr:fused response regulator/phosphatase [Ancylobacter gelatini]MCJ8143599.1 fused response regulator/phosphatase [Ancylobacter gelatini]